MLWENIYLALLKVLLFLVPKLVKVKKHFFKFVFKCWLQNWSPSKIYILTTCDTSQSRKPLYKLLSKKPLCQVSHNCAVVGQDSHLNTKHFKVHCIQQSICLLSSPCRVNLLLHCHCHSLSYKSEPKNVYICLTHLTIIILTLNDQESRIIFYCTAWFI